MGDLKYRHPGRVSCECREHRGAVDADHDGGADPARPGGDELAALLARRLYYTTSYLVDLQQQAAGRREDLDVVDKILAQLVQSPDDAKVKKKK